MCCKRVRGWPCCMGPSCWERRWDGSGPQTRRPPGARSPPLRDCLTRLLPPLPAADISHPITSQDVSAIRREDFGSGGGRLNHALLVSVRRRPCQHSRLPRAKPQEARPRGEWCHTPASPRPAVSCKARTDDARGAGPGRFGSAREAVLLSPELLGGLVFPFLREMTALRLWRRWGACASRGTRCRGGSGGGSRSSSGTLPW
jgi:hypothetical protein